MVFLLYTRAGRIIRQTCEYLKSGEIEHFQMAMPWNSIRKQGVTLSTQLDYMYFNYSVVS